MDNIEIDLAELGLGSMDWIGLVKDKDNWKAFVNAVINVRFL
jgi:hypothetical protein